MKKCYGVCLAACMMLVLAACGSGNKGTPADSILSGMDSGSQAQDQPQSQEVSAVSSAASDAGKSAEKKHILVAYFSQAGEQYGVGVVEKGNTQIVAEMIADETGADLFHIERTDAYPTTYTELTEAAQEEMKDKARPKLTSSVENWDDYDTVFIGYPIWWGDMPMPVYTFLESYDFSGKTVIPFDTNGGSGLGGTVDSIKNETGADPKEGFAISGVTAQQDQEETGKEVKDWISGLEIR